LNDVGVVQSGRELRLIGEHDAKSPAADEVREDSLENQKLECPFGSTLLGEEDLGHAAYAQPSHDLEICDVFGHRAEGRLGSQARRARLEQAGTRGATRRAPVLWSGQSRPLRRTGRSPDSRCHDDARTGDPGAVPGAGPRAYDGSRLGLLDEPARGTRTTGFGGRSASGTRVQ